jgi:PAS domain S-box-containing protein
MKISAKLRLAMLVPAIMALVVIVALVFSIQETGKIQATGNTVRQIRSSITELNHIVFSYILYHEERPKQQFLAEHKVLTQLITSTRVNNPDQQRLLNNISENNEAMADLFQQLVSTDERDITAGVVDIQGTNDRLVGLLLLKSYEADTNAASLRTLVDNGIRTNEIRAFGFIFLLLIVTTVLLTLVLDRMSQSVNSSISKLNEGAAVIGSGNLDYKIDEKMNDELGDLSRSFNRMTSSLKEVTASKTDLEKEIEEHKKATEELENAEFRYRTVADNTYDFEFWLNPEGKFLYASPSCQRIYGHSSEEFMADSGLGRRVIHPADLTTYDRHIISEVNKHVHGEIEFRIVRPDGIQRWIAHVCQPIFDEHGQYLGVRGSNRDITESKK